VETYEKQGPRTANYDFDRKKDGSLEMTHPELVYKTVFGDLCDVRASDVRTTVDVEKVVSDRNASSNVLCSVRSSSGSSPLPVKRSESKKTVPENESEDLKRRERQRQKRSTIDDRKPKKKPKTQEKRSKRANSKTIKMYLILLWETDRRAKKTDIDDDDDRFSYEQKNSLYH
jgi:hypothetical protein